MTIAAVSDTGPLIHLGEIGSLDLLSAFDTLSVPAVVLDELDRGDRPDGLTDLSYEVVEVTDRESRSEALDAGERAALAVAARRDAVLLTDDLDARETAAEIGVEVRGSIGVIALGYSRGKLDREEAADRMRALQRETSLFVTDAVIERGIRLLGDR